MNANCGQIEEQSGFQQLLQFARVNDLLEFCGCTKKHKMAMISPGQGPSPHLIKIKIWTSSEVTEC